jgi:hypothetical protein
VQSAISGATAAQTLPPDPDPIRQQALRAAADALSNVADISDVPAIQFRDGTLQIEIKTTWPGRIRQAAVSYTVVRVVAERLAKFDREQLEAASGSPFAINLTTYSSEGEYRFRSVTDWETVQKLASNSISYEEWVVLADGGFR